MKLIIAIALSLASVSTFADMKCIRDTQNQIESVKAVSNYKLGLIKTVAQSEDEAEKEKAGVALGKLVTNIIDITYEACEAADNK